MVGLCWGVTYVVLRTLGVPGVLQLVRKRRYVIAIAFNGSFDFENFSRTTIPWKIMTKQLGKSGKNIFTLYFYNHMTILVL